MVCLGSNPVPGNDFWAPNTLSSARLESGLDDSPMWDATTFNTTTHQMQLYELSQSSFYVAEAEHLIQLAALVNRSDAVEGLAAKAATMRKLIAENLWDEENTVFTNKYGFAFLLLLLLLVCARIHYVIYSQTLTLTYLRFQVLTFHSTLTFPITHSFSSLLPRTPHAQ